LPQSQIAILMKIRRVQDTLHREGNHTPSDELIAERLQMKVEDVTVALQADRVMVEINDYGEGEDQLPLIETLEDEEQPPPDANLMKDSMSVAVRSCLSCLTRRESEVVIRYYGLDQEEAETLQSIGDGLGLTRERIRQIKEEALEKLRGVMEQDPFFVGS